MKALKENGYIKSAILVAVALIVMWCSLPVLSDSTSQQNAISSGSKTSDVSGDDDSSMIPEYGRGGGGSRGGSRASAPRVAPRPVSRPSYSAPRVSRPVSQPRYTAPRVSRTATQPSRTSVRTQPTRAHYRRPNSADSANYTYQRQNATDSADYIQRCSNATDSSNLADLERGAASNYSDNTP